MDECQYPDVFDSDTKSCRDFHEVDCEERDIIYNGCGFVLLSFVVVVIVDVLLLCD